MLLLGALGWGLLTIGGITHVWHHDRLRELLARHLDRERPAALLLVAVELAVAVLLPVGFVADAGWVGLVAIAAALVGLGFTAWIGRLLVTGSELPCACSFAEGPTSPWSLARAVLVTAAGAVALAETTDATSVDVATFAVGLAAAAALFLVPEAISWPDASRAQLARLDSHTPQNVRS